MNTLSSNIGVSFDDWKNSSLQLVHKPSSGERILVIPPNVASIALINFSENIYEAYVKVMYNDSILVELQRTTLAQQTPIRINIPSYTVFKNNDRLYVEISSVRP